MSRIRTFSRRFPAYHPRKGQPTYFVEKIYKSLYLMKVVPKELVDTFNFEIMNDDKIAPKHHTIRKGNHFKVGDTFSPRIWGDNINPKSGKKGAYQSTQIIIAEDITVRKTWSFEMYGLTVLVNDKPIHNLMLSEIAKNDGLSLTDFKAWFKLPFIGQIICWNENINY